ncbi:MAG: hypothetical protein H6851_13570 [Geminicoccaceae bacterium]|nr:hypothetical protein [Geminicoccaceae bacterium]
MRILLQYLLPFLVPFAAYFGWRWLVSNGRDFLDDTPWYVLTVTGLGFVVVALFALGLQTEGSPNGIYVPPHVENGLIVPGHVREP